MCSKSHTSSEVPSSGPNPFQPVSNERTPASPEGRCCPDCGSSIQSVDVLEAVCPDCHVVLTDQPISTAPRPLYESDDLSKARTGSRLTFLYADRGLGTGIEENARTDGKGGNLSRSQQRVAREKPWTKHRTSKEVRLDYALGEIRRMREALGIPEAESERAAQLYRKTHAEGLITGRSVDGFATVCLLVAIRQSSLSLPVSQKELSKVSRARQEQIRTARGVLEFHLEVEIPPMEPQEFLPKAASNLSTPCRVRECARTLLKARSADENRECRGVSPRTLAAAALHAAYDISGCEDRPKLTELAEKFSVSASTVSDRKSLLTPYQHMWNEDED